MKHVYFPFFAGFWMRLLQRGRLFCDFRYQEMDYARDPLAHPDILRMSEQQKADLPFTPSMIKDH